MSALSVTTFSSFSQSSKRSQNKRGIKKRKGLGGNAIYEHFYDKYLRYGDGREYIVTKEEYDGQIFMRYCFLRNCKFKYVHLGEYDTCAENFEILHDGMMVYDSKK
jgi:hypothetical protein